MDTDIHCFICNSMQLLDDNVNAFLHGNTLYYYIIHYSSTILLGMCRHRFKGMIVTVEAACATVILLCYICTEFICARLGQIYSWSLYVRKICKLAKHLQHYAMRISMWRFFFLLCDMLKWFLEVRCGFNLV